MFCCRWWRVLCFFPASSRNSTCSLSDKKKCRMVPGSDGDAIGPHSRPRPQCLIRFRHALGRPPARQVNQIAESIDSLWNAIDRRVEGTRHRATDAIDRRSSRLASVSPRRTHLQSHQVETSSAQMVCWILPRFVRIGPDSASVSRNPPRTHVTLCTSMRKQRSGAFKQAGRNSPVDGTDPWPLGALWNQVNEAPHGRDAAIAAVIVAYEERTHISREREREREREKERKDTTDALSRNARDDFKSTDPTPLSFSTTLTTDGRTG